MADLLGISTIPISPLAVDNGFHSPIDESYCNPVEFLGHSSWLSAEGTVPRE